MFMSSVIRLKTCCLVSIAFFFGLSVPAYSLSPEEVLVIANQNASESTGLAHYYIKKRKIPDKNLVLLFMTDKETCTRKDYVSKVIPPVRRFLEKNNQIRAIVTIYGVPLKISSPGSTQKEKNKLDQLNQKKENFENQLSNGEPIDLKIKKKIQHQLNDIKKKISAYKTRLDKTASFDSELSLVKVKEYNLNMWLPNPFFLSFRTKNTNIKQSDVLMTSRLDGSSAKIVKRIINDTLEAEKNGIKGTAYFDARWKNSKKREKNGYELYDQSLHLAAQELIQKGKINVVIDDTSKLFQKGQCPSAALYCGWYSLAQYIDAFEWQKGSVGYHIASSECATLKSKHSQVWCKKMLDNGVAATIGPVGEPYIQAFPMPEIFFKFLTNGNLTLAESYLVSHPYLSWKMVLVGDPLYRLNLKQ